MKMTTLPIPSKPRLISRLIRLQLKEALQRLSRQLGVNLPIDLTAQELALPDTAIVTKALTFARQVMPPETFKHCMRTWQFGLAIGKHEQALFDREVFFLSAVMHDIGLAPQFDQAGDFEINGANAAFDFLQELHFDLSKSELVHEAIALHSSVGIAHKHSVEGRLVHYGAGVDVIGIQRHNIATDTLRTILEQYPRTQFLDEFIPLLQQQAKAKPDCHIAASLNVGFADQMCKNPLCRFS